MNILTLKKTISFGLSLMLTFMTVLASPASGQNSKAWTAIASAGVVDDEDADEVAMSNQVAQLEVGGAGAINATIRYNVTATDGLFTPLGVPKMRVRYADNGQAAQVIVRLIRVSLNDGSATQMLELDSNDFASGAGFQTRTTAPCEAKNYPFNFTDYAYYVEAKLIRNNHGGAPKLGIIQVYSEVHDACHGGN